MKTLLPILFWIVTWTETCTYAPFGDLVKMNDGTFVEADMGIRSITTSKAEKFYEKKSVKLFVESLKKSDRNASDIRVFEYREVK